MTKSTLKESPKTIALLALSVVLSAESVLAIPTLSFSSGANSLVFDGTVVSSSGSVSGSGGASGGFVTWSGNIGVWNFNVTVGQTINGGSFPDIDLQLGGSIPTALGTPLTVMYSDTGFGPTTGSVNLTTTGGGVHGGSVATTAYLGNNTLFDQSGGQLLNGSVINVPGLYSLTIVDQITGGTIGQSAVNSLDTQLSVPDGGTTLGLLGFALLGVAGVRRKLTA